MDYTFSFDAFYTRKLRNHYQRRPKKQWLERFQNWDFVNKKREVNSSIDELKKKIQLVKYNEL